MWEFWPTNDILEELSDLQRQVREDAADEGILKVTIAPTLCVKCSKDVDTHSSYVTGYNGLYHVDCYCIEVEEKTEEEIKGVKKSV